MQSTSRHWWATVASVLVLSATSLPTGSAQTTASPVTYATYIGCFQDGTTRVLPNQFTAENYTIGGCLQAANVALNGQAGYAGVEAEGQCFYGTSKPTVTASNCNYVCKSDTTQNCGGYYAISTYALQPTASATPTTAPATSAPACQTQGNFQQSCSSISYNTTVGHCSIRAYCQNANGYLGVTATTVTGLTTSNCVAPYIQNCNGQLRCGNCDGTPYATAAPTTTAAPSTAAPTTTATPTTCPATLACPAHDTYGYATCTSAANTLKCLYSDSLPSTSVYCSGNYYCQYSSNGQLAAGGDHDGGLCAKTMATTACGVAVNPAATAAPTTTSVRTTIKPITASPYSFATYIGCFADGYYQGPRDFPNKMLSENHTIGSCLQAAKVALNGVAGYAGVEYGGQCFYGLNKPTVTATNCDYTCTSDPTQNCGGFYAISTYALQGTAPVTSATTIIAATSPPTCQTQGSFQQSCTYIVYNTTLGHCSITASCQNANGVYTSASVFGLTTSSCPSPYVQNCNGQLKCANCDGTPYATAAPTTTPVPITTAPSTTAASTICAPTVACPIHDTIGFNACPSMSNALKCVYSDYTGSSTCTGTYYCQYSSSGKLAAGGDHDAGGCPQTVSMTCGNSTAAPATPATNNTASPTTSTYNYSNPFTTQAAVNAMMYLTSGCALMTSYGASWYSQQLVSSLTAALPSASSQWQLAPVCAATYQPQSNTHHHRQRLQASSSSSEDGVLVTVTILPATNYSSPANLFSQLQLQARNSSSALHRQSLTSSLLAVDLYTAAATPAPATSPPTTSQSSSSISTLPAFAIAIIAAAGGAILIAAVCICLRRQRALQPPEVKPSQPPHVTTVAIGPPALPSSAVVVYPHDYPAPPSYAQYLQDQLVSYSHTQAAATGPLPSYTAQANHPYFAHYYAVNPHACAPPPQYYLSVAG